MPILRPLLIKHILTALFIFAYASLFILPKIAFATDPTGSWNTSLEILPNSISSHGSVSKGDNVLIIGGANTDDYSDVFLSGVNNGGSLSGWQSTIGLPDTRYWISTAMKEDRIYVVGGARFDGGQSFVNTVYSAELNSDGTVSAWQTFTALPDSRALGNAVVVGDRIYYTGGFNDSGVQDEIFYADINSSGTIGAWTTSLVSLPEPLYGFGMVEYQNNIIVFGGATTGDVFRNKVYKASIDPVTGSISPWVELLDTPLPVPVYRGSSIRIGSTLISVAGHNGTSYINKVYYAEINPDGTVDPWQESLNVLPQGMTGSAIASANGFLYVTGGFSSIGYLDTVYFASVNTITDFKQTNPDWSTSPPYDPNNIITSTRLNNSSTCDDMYGFGCAVTSVADVFYSYGKTILSNNGQLNPGKLNEWLSGTPKGFVGCSIYWNTASAAVKIGSPEIIERNNKENWPEGAQKIDEALNNGNLPILGINTSINNISGTHFLVISEKLPDVDGKPDYKLIDPALYPFVENSLGNSGKALSEVYGGFDNVFKAVIYKKGTSPQNTLAIGGHSPVQLFMTDLLGNTTGYDLTTGEIIENIPNSSYGVEPGIVPVDGHAPASIEKKYFQLTNPTEGEYTLQVIGTGTGEYTLGFARTDEQANVSTQLIGGVISEGTVENYKIQYMIDASELIIIEKVITFDTLIQDINSLHALGEINFPNRVLLLAQAKIAKKLASNNLTKKASVKILKAMQKTIVKQKGKGVSETAYQILNEDIEALLL